eukprot:619415-Alexandrium_andersonii.AAC.1
MAIQQWEGNCRADRAASEAAQYDRRPILPFLEELTARRQELIDLVFAIQATQASILLDASSKQPSKQCARAAKQ